MEIKDTYKTLAEPSEETLLKEKNSKFLGYAFPVTTEEEIKPILLGLRKPVHVLQLGSSVREIVNMVTIAVVDAQTRGQKTK